MDTTINVADSMAVEFSSPASMTDEELLLHYHETEDCNAFEELVARYEGELYSYLRRYLGNAEAAEDVFQATFLQVHLKCEQFERGRRVRPWLYSIATNQAIDYRRRNHRHTSASLTRIGRGAEDDDSCTPGTWMVSNERGPVDNAVRAELTGRLRYALAQLSDPMRLVIHLVYYQGLKYRDAADVLSVPVGTVKSRMHAAIAKLNQIWHANYGDVGDPK
jgi:RNA polymerase sigma-70 factor (ECF subfamily)